MQIDSPNATGISTGFGIPTGGTANQVLVKNTLDNYDTFWSDPTGLEVSYKAFTGITEGYAVRLGKDGLIYPTDFPGVELQPIIGIAQTSGETDSFVSVILEGGLSPSTTELKPTFNYYADANGLITLTGETYVGTAISTDTLQVWFGTPNGVVIPSLSIIDNSITDPDNISVPGRYIVPVSGVTGQFIGEENDYADYDGVGFTFTTPTNNDKVVITTGINSGNVYLFASGATSGWTISSQTTTLPTSNWSIGVSYKQFDLVIYQSILYQANGNVPANTAFSIGTSGATFKLIGSTSTKRTITSIKSNPGNGCFIVADGIYYVIRGGNNVPYLEGSGLNYPGPFGAINAHELVLPPSETGLVQEAGVYGNSSYILFANRNLYVAGQNNRGQLGLGDTTERTLYTLTNTNVVKVFTSSSNADRGEPGINRLIIQKTDGKIYGCGANDYGSLGLGNATASITSWTEMTWCGTSPLSVWNMGTTLGCTYCQKSDGTIFACGYNGYGQLGTGSAVDVVSTAVNVTTNWTGGLSGMIIQSVLGGYGFFDGNLNNEGSTTMFLDNGSVSRIASAGGNTWGTLGDTTTSVRTTPVVPTGFSGRVRQIGRMGGNAGSVHVVKTDNTYWNWGYNANGQLGRGNTTNPITTPAQVRTDVAQMFDSNYATFVTGYKCTSPILETATQYLISGVNNSGQLGVGDQTDRNVFTQMRFPGGTRLSRVGTLSTINDLISRYAVDTNGYFYTWGENSYNACFDSTTVDVVVPMKVSPPAFIK